MSKTILIVDDSSTMRQIVRATLTNAGYAVVEAENGREAVERLREIKPHLVITDLHMPVMDGLTFIRSVRAEPAYRTLPILMLTTEADESKKQEGRLAGATGWIVKPFNPERMLAIIGKVLPA